MRPCLIAILLVLAGGRAWAAEFTGFYAGINSGYASGRNRTATAGPGAGEPRTGAPGDTGADLPPSAVGAAAAMRKPGRAEAGSGQR